MICILYVFHPDIVLKICFTYILGVLELLFFEKAETAEKKQNASGTVCFFRATDQSQNTPFIELAVCTHRIHIWCIYLHVPYHKNHLNVGKYTIHGFYTVYSWYGPLVVHVTMT